MTERPYKTPKNLGQEALIEAFELPRLIDTPYPSVSIGDLGDTTKLIIPDGIDPEAIEALEEHLHGIKQTIAPSDVQSTFYYISADKLAKPLEAMAAREAERTDRTIGVVHLDKFIGKDQNGSRFSRLNVSRNPDNKLMARVGTIESPDEQLEALTAWAREISADELLFIDDVVAFGNTFPPLLEKIREQLPDVTFRILAGIAASGGTWRGIEKIYEETGIEVEYLTKALVSPKVEGSSTGLAIPVSRDFTLLGGKTSRKEDGTQLSHPYFLPFSKPLPSAIATNMRIESAHMLHDFSALYCDVLSAELGSDITIGDLTAGGLGIPTSSLKCLEGIIELPDSSMSLKDYLEYTRTILMDNVEAIAEECAS